MFHSNNGYDCVTIQNGIGMIKIKEKTFSISTSKAQIQ